MAADATVVFAAQVTCQRESHLVQELRRLIVVLDLDAVVRVNARSSQGCSACPQSVCPQSVFAHAVVVEDQRDPLLRAVQDLATESRLGSVTTVRLPTVNNPGLDLQLVRGKPLNAKSVEKPWSVRGYIGRLVSPVVEVVVAEEPDMLIVDWRGCSVAG